MPERKTVSQRRILEALGFILLFACSFFIATRLVALASLRSAHTNIPGDFAVVIFHEPDGVSLRRWADIGSAQGLDQGQSYFFPREKVADLNLQLAGQYTGHGGSWHFEVLDGDSRRQYLRVVTSGSTQITESWYWATERAVEPDAVRHTNLGIVVVVLPLALLFTACGVVPYVILRRRAAGRAN